MKKKEQIEMKIYESLGIKMFRKMAFCLRDILCFPLKLSVKKEERKDFFNNMPSNYNIGKNKDLEHIKKFKGQLLFNALLHLSCLLFLCLPESVKIGMGDANLYQHLIYYLTIGVNSYCIMLQRYNEIRIDDVIERMTPKYEKQKEKIKEDIKESDNKLFDHVYKMVDKKEREKDISLDELIESASLEDLKKYRYYIKSFQENSSFLQKMGYYDDNRIVNMSAPIKKNKTLKLELDPKNYNKSK